MRIYATYNIKGGVGKTTTAVNLAYLAADSGLRTVLWDLDPQGAASFMFRVKPKVKGGGRALISGRLTLDDAIKGTDFDNLDLIPADFTYRNMDLLLNAGDGGAGDAAAGDAKGGDAPGGKPARKLAKLLAPLAAEYDAVFLDCPPSVSLVSENVLHAADVIVVPLIPTTLSVRTLDQLQRLRRRVQGPQTRDPRLLLDDRPAQEAAQGDHRAAVRRAGRGGADHHPRAVGHRDDVGGARPGRGLRPGELGGEGLPVPVGGTRLPHPAILIGQS